MRYIFLFLCFVTAASAQTNDTLPRQRVLLVAYSPEYYLSDAEQDLIKQNRRTPDDYRNFLRRALDNKIAAELEKSVSIYSLLSDTSGRAAESTWDFYNHSGMKYVTPYGGKTTDKPGKKKASTREDDQHAAHAYNEVRGDLKVLDNTVKDSAWIRAFCRQFDCEYILSVNQFEIRTNYNSCMDIANQVYRREVLVHYTLLNSSGRQLHGNVAIAAFPSSRNRVEEISEKVLPEIAGFIAARVQGTLQ